MKNLVKFVGIIAFFAVIGFSIAACDDVSKDGGTDGITISGTPKIGEKITATISGKYLSGPRWEISDDGVSGWNSIYGSDGISMFVNTKEITIPSIQYHFGSHSTEGKYIRAYLSLDYSGERAYSNVIGPIQP